MISLPEGTLFAHRYRIVRLIGQGGMGAVYEVVHLETERRRALKVMHPNIIENEEMRGRFRQEAKVAAHVDSEYIVDVFDAGIDEATRMPFLVMELLRGEELKKKLKAAGRLPPHEVVYYLYQASLALDKTHRANIIHRDLKPENLFVTYREDGRPHVKVLDFGVAKFITDGGTQANSTRSLGTPLYMAPEQFIMTNTVSPQTDVYALGMIAYTLLVGASYWADEAKSGANIFAFAALMSGGPPEPATQRAAKRGAQLSPAFDAWFARITARNPGDRFETASAAVMALADVLGVARPGFEQNPVSLIPSAPSPASGSFSAGSSAGPAGAGFSATPTPAAVASIPGVLNPPISSSSISGDQSHATGAALASTAGASKSSKGKMTIALALVATLVGVGIGVVVLVSGRKGADAGAATEGAAAASSLSSLSPTAQSAPASQSAAMVQSAAPAETAAPPPSVDVAGPALVGASTAEAAPPPSASATAASKAAKTKAGAPPSAAHSAPVHPKKDLFTRD